MVSSEESSSSTDRPMSIAFPLEPLHLGFPAELADKFDKEFYVAILKANVTYLRECANAEVRLYKDIGIILDNVKT